MNRLLPALLLPLGLAVGQQQLLLRQPPRLLAVTPSAASSGPAGLELRFSRPMNRASVAAASRIDPPLPVRWLAAGSSLKLSLNPGVRLRGPLQLELAGLDNRGQQLATRRWAWDPRPRILAVVPVPGGEQLQLQQHNGRWQPLSPVWPRIFSVEVLGDGSGVAVVSQGQRTQGPAGQQIWLIPVQQRNLARAQLGLGPPQPGQPRALGQDRHLFAHLSSNRFGDLLIQSGGLEPGSARTLLWPRRAGRPTTLPFEANGPMRLLPQGGAVVVPISEGLSLQDLPPRAPRQQLLPGSRDLSSFCPRAGLALLVRHWPDFRRSLELVEPGRPPRQLWIGQQAVLASSCQGNGERFWIAQIEGIQRPVLTVLAMNREGRILARRSLPDWELEPGTPLSFDASNNNLLLVLRPWVQRSQGSVAPSAQAMVMDATSLALRPLGKQARLALWLPP